MARIKRKDVLSAIRVAGYHGQYEKGELLYIKNWISLQAYKREFDAGAAMRQNGVPCDCLECRKEQFRALAPPPHWLGAKPGRMCDSDRNM